MLDKKVTKNKISETAARAQVDKLLYSYDINQGDVVVDQGENAINTVINRLVRAVEAGRLEINDDNTVTHHLHLPKGDITLLTYARLNGNALRAADKADGKFNKDCALMGSLANVPPNVMASLDAIDISIFQRLSTLFMVA